MLPYFHNRFNFGLFSTCWSLLLYICAFLFFFDILCFFLTFSTSFLRDTEIDELRTQLSRMQEDWIEEEELERCFPFLSYGFICILLQQVYSLYLSVSGTSHVQNTLSFMEGKNQVLALVQMYWTVCIKKKNRLDWCLFQLIHHVCKCGDQMVFYLKWHETKIIINWRDDSDLQPDCSDPIWLMNYNAAWIITFKFGFSKFFFFERNWLPLFKQ